MSSDEEQPGPKKSDSAVTPCFFSVEAASDLLYELNRDHEGRAHVRELVEDLWSRFARLNGDPHFLSDARANFHQRTWELVLAGVLDEAGLQLVGVAADAPDVCIGAEAGAVWVEAVAPTPGTGGDRAERIITREEQTALGSRAIYLLDHDKMILRYTAALRDKASLTKHKSGGSKSQYVGFRDRGVIAESDPFVVAINAGLIDDADLERHVPTIVRAVLPIGEAVYSLPIGFEGEPRVDFPYSDVVAKASGAAVSTSAFLSQEYENVSAILFSPHGVWNVRDLSGEEFICIVRARPVPS